MLSVGQLVFDVVAGEEVERLVDREVSVLLEAAPGAGAVKGKR